MNIFLSTKKYLKMALESEPLKLGSLFYDKIIYFPNKRLPFSEVERYFHNFDHRSGRLLMEEASDYDESYNLVKFIEALQEPTEATHFEFSVKLVILGSRQREQFCLVLKSSAPTDLEIPTRKVSSHESIQDAARNFVEEEFHSEGHISLLTIIDSVPDSKTHNIVFVYGVGFLKPFDVDRQKMDWVSIKDIESIRPKISETMRFFDSVGFRNFCYSQR